MSSPVSLGCPDHSPQPALTATPQAPPPTLQAPIPKLVPKRGMKQTLQTSMDQFLRPNTPTMDESESDAIVVMCYRCCTCSAAVIKWYGFVVQSPPPYHRGDRHFMTPPPPLQPDIKGGIARGGQGISGNSAFCALYLSQHLFASVLACVV